LGVSNHSRSAGSATRSRVVAHGRAAHSPALTRIWPTLALALLTILLSAPFADVARAQQEARTFANPVMRGVRLDWCKHWGRECGKPAADLFCKESGFQSAQRFQIAKGVGRTGATTLVFGDGRVCRGPTCDGFSAITCIKAAARGQQQAAPGARTLQAPIRRGDELTIKRVPMRPVQPSQPRTPNRQGQGATIQRVPVPPIQPPGARAPRTPDRQGQGATIQRVPVPPIRTPGQGDGLTVQRIPIPPIRAPGEADGKGGVRMRNVCALKPENCCPNRQRATLCKALAETLLDIRIRSYVPPRFTVMDDVNSIQLAGNKIVSDITKGRPYNVRPGCRFSPVAMRNKIRNEMNVFQQMGELFTAWTAQWNSGLRSAKSFIAKNVAKAICGTARTGRVPVSRNCEDKIASHTRTGMDAWLASMGIPPEFPDINQLRDHGIQYLAAEATSYAIGDAGILLDEIPVDAATREDIYDKLYNKTYDAIRDELDKITPSVDVKQDNPLTWGHLDPAFAPHNAHVYVTINVKPRMEAAYRRLFRASPKHKWPPLYLHDLNDIYQDVGPIDIPKVIPTGGLIVPIELRPATGPTGGQDRADTQIPGTPVSRAWLQNKFGLLNNDSGSRGTPTSNVLTSQRNYLYGSSANWFGSEYDLFYPTNGRYNFRLLSAFGAEGPVHWVDGLSQRTGSVWDAQTGIGVRTGAKWDRNQRLKRYYGLIEPAPRCDGQAAKVIF